MALALVSSRFAPPVSASGSLETFVKDERGKPLSDAVVSLTQVGGTAPPPRPASAVMDQQNRTFVPLVLAVPVGTAVTFPNRDNIRHHVYSFSSPKRFELPLYMGTPAAPVLFDKPGVVVLGCNIHDWMVGYVVIVPTPYFAKSDATGGARLRDLPAGAYEVRAWHPQQRTAAQAQSVSLDASGMVRTSFEIDSVARKPRFKPPLDRLKY